VSAADAGLYAAKQTGRNRICLAPRPDRHAVKNKVKEPLQKS